MYKDKERQREANRQAKRKQRVRDNEPQGMTKGMTKEDNVIPKTDIRVIPCESHVDASDVGAVKALHQLINKPKRGKAEAVTVWESEPGAAKKIKEIITGKPELTANGNIRVSKPGDSDYVPQCETTRAFVEGRPKTTRFPTHKRGKDIKCFEDLPKDIQETINQLCRIDDNRIDATAKANRTAIAINYQHLFPDRYHSTGV